MIKIRFVDLEFTKLGICFHVEAHLWLSDPYPKSKIITDGW